MIPLRRSTVLILLLLGFATARAESPVGAIQARPRFEITPLVAGFRASPGAALRFSFDIRALAADTTVLVEPVALGQEETGQIFPIEGEAGSRNLSLTTPARLQLAAGQTRSIEGRVVVANLDSPLQTYGILVTDLGRDPPGETEFSASSTRLGVRFVTRYLLRVEIEVPRFGRGLARSLRVNGARLVDEEGFPAVRVHVDNESDAPLEFELRSTLLSGDRRALVPFRLVMPIRVRQGEPDRYRCRILGRARLRLEGELPGYVPPGQYTLRNEVLVQRRAVSSSEVPVTVGEGEYPAQDVLVGRVGSFVEVTPAQMLLSLQPRGDRLIPLEIRNRSEDLVSVNLGPRPHDELDELDWLLVRPRDFTLRGGESRRVLVAVKRARMDDSHRFARLEVLVRNSSSQVIASRELPVALTTARKEEPSLRIEPGSFTELDEGSPGWSIPLRNEGACLVVLRGRLEIEAEARKRLEVQSGYDRWLLPGEETQLVFRLPEELEGRSVRGVVLVEREDGTDPWREEVLLEIPKAR